MRSKVSPLRTLAVTLALVAAGGVVGVVCSALAFAIVLGVVGEPIEAGLHSIWGAFGAVISTIVAPLGASLATRRRPCTSVSRHQKPLLRFSSLVVRPIEVKLA